MSITTLGYDYNGKKYNNTDSVCKAVIDDFMKQHPNLIGVTQGETFRYKCSQDCILGDRKHTLDYVIFLTIEKRSWGTDIETYFCVAPNCVLHADSNKYFFSNPFSKARKDDDRRIREAHP